MALSFYPWLADRPDEPPGYLDDLGYTWWQAWYGNGQIRQLMGDQKIRCAAPCVPDLISQDATHKVYRMTLQKVNASNPNKSIGQSYTRDISFVKDAQDYWWIDSFDPISAS